MRRFTIATFPFPPIWIGCVFGLSVALSLGAFAIVRNWERQALQTQAAELVREQLGKLESTILRSTEVLHSIAALYGARGQLQREEFHRFVSQALERQPELQAVSWNPRIAREDRPIFERRAFSQPLTEFCIREKDASGKLVRAGERSEYVPVYLIEPPEGNTAALGYDLSSDPVRRRSLDLARQTGRTVATAPLRLAQKAGPESGFLVLLPVWERSRGSEVPEEEGTLAPPSSVATRMTRKESGHHVQALVRAKVDSFMRPHSYSRRARLGDHC